METEGFPSEFLRGIACKDFVNNGHVLYSAFKFDDNSREDHLLELSINWHDDSDAVEVALQQRKDNGKIQFSFGIANLNLDTVKLFLASIPKGIFSYERRRVPDNIYHGNLLVHSSADTPLRHLVMNGLALAAGTNIILQTNE